MRHLEFGVKISVLHLYNGRRSLYIALTLGHTTFWIQRWDAPRQPRGWFEPNGQMTWAVGSH